VAVAASVATIVTSGVYVASRTPAHRPASVDSASVAVADPQPTGTRMPTAHRLAPSTLLPAVQWHGSSGSLVLVDPASGTVVETLTSGLTDATHDILQQGTHLYFVATTDIHGCATHWSGIDLQSGQPVAAPASLDRPIDAAAVQGENIAISEGGCTPAQVVAVVKPQGDVVVGGSASAVHVRHLAWSRYGRLAYTMLVDGKFSAIDLPTMTVSPPKEIRMVDGCTPTALTWLQETVVAGLRCTKTDGTSTLMIVRYDASGSLTMRKDVPTAFKEATISDVSAGADGNIYYVVNAEGTDASAYQLTDGTDRLIGTNLFYLGDPVPAAGTTATETPTPASSGS
jgi:hypothetical protein